MTRRFGWNDGNFNEIVLHPDRLNAPLSWRETAYVFVDSMSDLFHPDVPVEYIERVWHVMVKARWHAFMILTKRPSRMSRVVRRLPYAANIWLGTSIESREYLGRLDWLRDSRAEIHFVSFEPLLESVGEPDLVDIEWVIVGGESGPNYRPFDEEWAREIRDLCRREGIPFFFKQHGGNSRCRCHGAWGCRVLDGRTWDQRPRLEDVADVPWNKATQIDSWT
jgi:protein gp37